MNLLKTSILILVSAAVAATADAAIINNTTAGNLSNVVFEPATETYLKVSGPINAADFNFITFEMPKLEKIDLSGATVTAYDGDAVLGGGRRYAANTIPAYAFFGTPASTIILPPTVTAIGEAAFASSGIKAIEIPASVKEIDRLAFDNCDALESVTIPATVTTLGDMMFRDCDRLASATIESPVNTIGDEMFLNCRSLASTTFSKVNTIGDNAFNGCTSLKTFTFDTSLNEIGKYAFYNSGIEKADMNKCGSLTSIGDFAFAKCGNLTDVSINTIAELGKGVFFDDTNLQYFLLPASVNSIPAFTFKGTVNLDPTTINDNITEINDYALTGWNTISEFTLPVNLAYIGDNAMEGWSSIKSIKASENTFVPQLGDNVWENVNQPDAILYVSHDTEDAFKNAGQWNNFTIEVESSGINTLVPDNTSDASDRVSFSLADRILVIESNGSDIVDTTIFDLDGRRRYSRSASAPRVVIDTNAWSGGVIIVSVRLADNSTASIKLSLN